jgi:hypothetical protein
MEKRPVFFAKQVWQLSDVRRDPPRFVFGEQFRSAHVIAVGPLATLARLFDY